MCVYVCVCELVSVCELVNVCVCMCVCWSVCVCVCVFVTMLHHHMAHYTLATTSHLLGLLSFW